MGALTFTTLAAFGHSAAVIQGKLAGHAWVAWPAFLANAPLTPAETQWLTSGLVVAASILVILVALKNLSAPARLKEPEFRVFEKYVHEKNHAFDNELNALKLSGEERRTESAEQSAAIQKALNELTNTLDGKRSVSVANLHTQLKAAELKLAKVESDASTHTQQLNQIDTKLTNILQLLPRKGGA